MKELCRIAQEYIYNPWDEDHIGTYDEKYEAELSNADSENDYRWACQNEEMASGFDD